MTEFTRQFVNPLTGRTTRCTQEYFLVFHECLTLYMRHKDILQTGMTSPSAKALGDQLTRATNRLGALQATECMETVW